MREFFYLIIHQSNICRIHGDIAADASHGNAHICFFQSRSIVDAVANHTDGFLIFLIRMDPLQFFFRPAAGMYFPDAKLPGDSFRGIIVIAGKKDWLHIQLVQLLNHRSGFRTDCVR